MADKTAAEHAREGDAALGRGGTHYDKAKQLERDGKSEAAEKEFGLAGNSYAVAAAEFSMAGETRKSADCYEYAGISLESKAKLNLMANTAADLEEAEKALRKALNYYDLAQKGFDGIPDVPKRDGVRSHVKFILGKYGKTGTVNQFDLPTFSF